jgi:hypothetical protein
MESMARRRCGASWVLLLAKKYGTASTDNACAMALETGTCEYHVVRRYLERNPQLPLSPSLFLRASKASVTR